MEQGVRHGWSFSGDWDTIDHSGDLLGGGGAKIEEYREERGTCTGV